MYSVLVVDELGEHLHDFAVGRSGHNDYVQLAVVQHGHGRKSDIAAERHAVAKETAIAIMHLAAVQPMSI